MKVRKIVNLSTILFTSAFLIWGGSGCARFVIYDYWVSLKIHGTLLQKSGNTPITNAEVIFSDVSMDYSRKGKYQKIIGLSNDKGEIGCEYDYFWGTKNKVGTEDNAPKQFEIIIQKDGKILFGKIYSQENPSMNIDIGTLVLD